MWESYAADMRPKLPGRPANAQVSSDAKAEPTPPKQNTPIPEFRVGEAVRHDKASVSITPAAQAWARTARMDTKTFGKMKKGRMAPEARIDLHGMTVEEAHAALIAFILSRQSQGKRLVLVITGKGRGDGPFPAERGILRRQVPHWLTLPPLAGAVLDVAPAHRRHGGEGAYYVYLRRPA